VIYAIEFQKRGLPHAHILIFLKDWKKCNDPREINNIIILRSQIKSRTQRLMQLYKIT